jgi:hypothetical protein
MERGQPASRVESPRQESALGGIRNHGVGQIHRSPNCKMKEGRSGYCGPNRS